jgi:AcrR family transcriptional regulator
LTQDPTKDRLIEAAGEEFAAKGFAGATIRAISERAGTNVAAINYHFRDKEGLYEAALLEAHRSGRDEADEMSEQGLAPQEVIRRFIHQFLTNIQREAQGSWQTAMMHRELVEPSKACDVLVSEVIRPRFERLSAAVRALCPEADDRRIHAMSFSIVAQCIHYKVACPISHRLIGDEAYDQLTPDFLTDHITAFSLAGLAALPFKTTHSSVEKEESPCTGSL